MDLVHSLQLSFEDVMEIEEVENVKERDASQNDVVQYPEIHDEKYIIL